jgi:hypothetical protein
VAEVRDDARYYGVAPAALLLAVAAACLGVAVVLFATGNWPFGLVALGISVLFVVLLLEAARRRPKDRVARATAGTLTGVRARGGLAADSLATRGRAARRVVALRRELRRLAKSRSGLLLEFGDAVYRGDDSRADAAREQLQNLDEQTAQREAEINTTVLDAQERLSRHRFEAQPTETIELPEEPSPAVIPEPYPPPDEGDPPQPAIIPEPEPPVIPEPGPEGSEEAERR